MKVCFLLDKNGEFEGIVSDSPIEAFIIQLSCLPDPVCDYSESVTISPEKVNELIETEPRDRNPKPTLKVIK